MKRILLLIAALGLACAAPDRSLQVDAAASLSDALGEAGRAWTARTGQRVQFNFAGSGTLARQIESGAPGDVFISADELQMDRVAAKSLIVAPTRRDVLSNVLVVVIPQGSSPIASLADLASSRFSRIALGDPQIVPAGTYAKEALVRAGVWKTIASRVVPTENVRGALAAVVSGNVDAAIVYRTDAAGQRVTIALEVPAQLTPPIRYAAAVLASTSDVARARDFLAFLATPPCAAIFRRYGFVVLR